MKRAVFQIGVAALAASLAAACATPAAQHSGHVGFFDRLSEGGRASPTRGYRRSVVVESENLKPVAVVRAHAKAEAAPPGAVAVDSKSDSKKNPNIEQVRADAVTWQWPLDQIRMTSPFGSRGGAFHEGIDLAASIGTPVHAVERGKVVFSGSRIRGYGRMIIVKHAGSGLLSVYAHLSRPLVKPGQIVYKGQRIALSGQTGRASGPHLHFEIRKGVTAFDPSRVLLKPRRPSIIARR